MSIANALLYILSQNISQHEMTLFVTSQERFLYRINGVKRGLVEATH